MCMQMHYTDMHTCNHAYPGTVYTCMCNTIYIGANFRRNSFSQISRMSLHLQKISREYLVRCTVYLSNTYVVGTGPLTKIKL